jgi:hypothetical protein
MAVFRGVNVLPASSVYPTFAPSPAALSTGMRVSGSAPDSPDTPATVDEMAAGSIGGQKSVLWAGLMFVGLLVVLMFAAQHLSDEKEDFRNIKASAYNALVIGLAAVVTIPVIKYLAAKVPIPGVKTWVMAA